jgi:ketosteroid isomerase-like protein
LRDTQRVNAGESAGEVRHDGEAALVRQVYDRWASGQDALDLMADDVVWDFSRRQVDPGVYHGHEGARRFMRELSQAWGELRHELSNVIPSGNRVLVILALKGSGRSSAIEVTVRIAHLWTVQNGKITSLEYFGDVAEAQRALEATS